MVERRAAAWRHVGRAVRSRTSVASVLVVILLAPTAAAAQSSGELERRLEERRSAEAELDVGLSEVRDEIAETEAQLARISARLDDARGRQRLAEGQVALAEAALLEARETQSAAEAKHLRAEALLVVADEELAEEEARFVDQVVRSYKYGTVGATRGAAVLEVLRRAGDPNAFAVGMKQLRSVVDDQDQTVQRMFELRESRAALAEGAERARGRAAQAAADAAATLRVVEELREEARELAIEVEAEEVAQRRILDSLQTTEAETAALLERVAGQARTLELQLSQQRAREEARRRREAEAAARANPGAPGSGSGRLGLPGADGGPGIDGVVCPVVGAVANRDFSNDWGYPRSGGRYHQGTDVFAAKGTPIVAVADGRVTSWNPPSSPTSLGGITITYQTTDGSVWYNAHLDGIAGGIAPGAAVARGQVIGTVGNTGNARTTPPHLHIGRRVGGAAVNPWPTIAPPCR